MARPKPFLRWAGGKSRIVKHLIQFLPNEPFSEYWEPFLGAGALFFALSPERSHLSDVNRDLISCFSAIKHNTDLVYRYLREHLAKNSEDYYYQIRGQYNTCGQSIAQAARFVYLNRAGFNGIYRVNRRGEYNVPYGHKEPPPAPSRNDLMQASELLQRATLSDCSYEVAISENALGSRDLVYLDPPYPPLNSTSNFNHFTPSRFPWREQRRVAEIARVAKDKGCFVMISNSDVGQIRELYTDWHIHTLPVKRSVAANGSRHYAAELVITSYPVGDECKL